MSASPSAAEFQALWAQLKVELNLTDGDLDVIAISDKAAALSALSTELKDLETLQIKVGEEMSVFLFKQMQLAERCRLINQAMEKLLT